MPHRQLAPLDARHDQRAETPFGILHMIGAIPPRLYHAGKWYAGVVSRYHAVIDAPKASPKSIAGIFEPKSRGYKIEDAAERKTDYDAAHDALAYAGRLSQYVISRVVIHGDPCPSNSFPALMRGLERLASHRELRGQQEPQQRGNGAGHW